MIATDLARWVTEYTASADDVALADRSLKDTMACAVAARDESIVEHARALGEGGRWAVASHILDFDDLHMPSTSHVSTVCVPATLAIGGGAHGYLAGAGVMARIGAALGWSHYSSGWHATTTSGAMGAAACASSALGLDADATAIALALAVPASGGVQRAFGTDAKSLQVGFAVDAGLRAARLAAAGVTADPRAVDEWLMLVGASSRVAGRLEEGAPAVPDGLAIKVYPCCYALQRPIAAVHTLRPGVAPAAVQRILVRTPASTVAPLVHHRPRTGLEGKFSMEYAVAAALIDEHCGFTTFTDDAVQRPEAQQLLQRVEVRLDEGGDGLLDGTVQIDVHTFDGRVDSATLDQPPGSPTRPPSPAELGRKLDECLAGSGVRVTEHLTWKAAPGMLRRTLGAQPQTTAGAETR